MPMTREVRAREGVDQMNDAAGMIGFLGFWDCDFQTGFVRASSDINRLFGCDEPHQGQASVDAYAARVHPDDVVWVSREHQSSVGESGYGVVEFRIIDDTGRIRWLMCHGLYERTSEGRVARGQGVMMDITPFKEDESAIRTAPAPLTNPLNRVVDRMIDAFSAAQQVGDSELIETLRSSLIIAARLLAEKIGQSSTPGHAVN